MRSNRKGALGFSAVPAMGPVLEFMRVVWALDHALQKTSKRMETTLGMTAPQRLVIRKHTIIYQLPGLLNELKGFHIQLVGDNLDQLRRERFRAASKSHRLCQRFGLDRRCASGFVAGYYFKRYPVFVELKSADGSS